MTSPASSSTVHLSGSRSARASSPPGATSSRPTAPGSPPASPHGRLTRRSVISDTVASSSTSRSRSMPSPPGCAPGAAAAPPQPVAQHPHRERPLERLDRRVARVGHAGVDAAHPRLARAAALPAADGLVVHPAVAADEHVVHRPLRRRAEPVRRPPRPRAPRHTSATRWLTSTLPAPTAAGGRAATTVPAGAIDLDGPQRAAVGGDRRVEWRERRANATALTVTASHRVDVAAVAGRRCR